MTTSTRVRPNQRMANSCRVAANTLIAIPVFNELEYVDDVLQAVRTYSDNILVVDDGSADGTSEVLGKHTYAQVISHQANMGYGQSLIEAFHFAFRHGFDWLITMDCDHQHEPSYIPAFYAEIEKDDADIISGSRYLTAVNSSLVPPPADRININQRVTDVLNRNLGASLTDSFCGFKAYRTEAVIKLELTEKGYGLPLQLWVQSGRAALSIREISVPLIYHDPNRDFGGVLEGPETRFDYYMEIIRRELKRDVSKDVAKANCS